MFKSLRHLLIPLSVMSSLPAAAQYSPLDALPSGSRSTLVVEQLESGQTLLTEGDANQLFPPASTLKLVTALAAKLELGDEFRFQTRLFKNQHDLIFEFGGDPTLMRADLEQMLRTARKSGLKQIKGDIWLDNSAFGGYDRAVGWPWDILGVCYSAPATSISLDGNCVNGSIASQPDGTTRVYVPEHFPIHASTVAVSVSETEQQANKCDLELVTQPNNQYQLQGCLVKRDKPLPLKFAVQDPGRYTQRTLYSLLRQMGIELQGEIKIGRPTHGKRQLIVSHSSAPLPELLQQMLQDSDNLIADSLTKTLGRQFYIQPGSFRNGTEAIKQILFAQAGIDLSEAQLADGSGLSRNNRVSRQQMSAVLRYLWQNDTKLGLLAKMPTSGLSGTLHYRRSMRQPDVKGKIIAKSGSVYGSYNMAGFGLDQQGRPNVLFVQFVSEYHPAEKQLGDTASVAPITRFENAFYQDVVAFSQRKPRNALTTEK